MERLTDATGTLEWARRYARRGWKLLPIAPGTKVPAVRNWQRFEATDPNLRYWIGSRRCGVALRTGESGFIVVDTDTPDAEQWANQQLPATPMTAVSGSGSHHRYYRAPAETEVRNKQRWRGIPGLDIRGHGGFIVLPPSIHPATGRPYEWTGDICDTKGLPTFSPQPADDQQVRIPTAIADILDPNGVLNRGRAYVDRLPSAVSGANGHTTTFVAALKIVKFVAFDRSLAWEMLRYYNATRCQPIWDERALQHKLDEAFKHAG